jgi:hypothetical protein
MFWSPADERRLIGRFYLSGCFGFAVITPFQRAYLVMDRPEWGVIPLLVSNAVALVFELPIGILSNRWSRKKCAVLGYGFSGATWVAMPLAVMLDGVAQLWVVCAAFAHDGLGAALASGEEDAWTGDNFKSSDRDDLVETFFARSYSFEALGSVFSGLAAFSDWALGDAFIVSMLTKGLDARALALLAVIEDMIGVAAPIFAVVLARRIGITNYLSLFLGIQVLAVSLLLVDSALWRVVLPCLVLGNCGALWDPIAEPRFHALIPSRHRATTTSVANQLTSGAQLAGLGIFAFMLGESSGALDDATPDIVSAFSGDVSPPPELPLLLLLSRHEPSRHGP